MKKMFLTAAICAMMVAGSAMASTTDMTLEKQQYAFVAMSNLDKMKSPEQIREFIAKSSSEQIHNHIVLLIYSNSVSNNSDPHVLALTDVEDVYRDTSFKELAKIK